mmetsp:Transcript_61766/g.144901  ORF Transcript_61766/g.144901 Transcript_61766/m.144901 type:complete len:166 (+) Transcript_61766:1046-1543(+)
MDGATIDTRPGTSKFTPVPPMRTARLGSLRICAISVEWYAPELDSNKSLSSCVHCTESDRIWHRLLGVRGTDDFDAVVGVAPDAVGLSPPEDNPFVIFERGEVDIAGVTSCGCGASANTRGASGESVFASVLSSESETSEDLDGNFGLTHCNPIGAGAAFGTALG